MINKVNENETNMIYDNLITHVQGLIEMVDVETGDESVKYAQKKVKDILVQLSEKIREEYSSLKRNTEWKRFTIALYGETNAGKSTVIEILRLLLKEETKQQEQEEFKKIEKRYHISEENFNAIRKIIMDSDQEIKTIQERIAQQKIISDMEIGDKREEVERLYKEVQHKKKIRSRSSFFKRCLYFFKNDPLKAKWKESRKEYICLQEKYEKIVNDLNNKIFDIRKNRNKAIAKENVMKEHCKKLQKFEDGRIIGDGSTDFTRSNKIYSFKIETMEFDLIDVPGIEGNEESVQGTILEAVQKAHVVFYVTRKPAAPQKGDGQEGILEKIKRHLGAQTEVWTIFNQSIINPIRFERELVDEDELKSLDNMHKVIENQLGKEHYRGEIILSAYPAFLGEAECLIPGSSNITRKRKFMEKYSREDLLNLTKLRDFVKLLGQEIVNNWQEKIIISNYNKAIDTLSVAVEKINLIQVQEYKPLVEKLIKTTRDSRNQIDNSFDTLKYNLQMVKSDIVETFRSNVRNEIYVKIDEDIDNDTFEYYLKESIEMRKDKLQNDFMEKTQNHLEDFRDELNEISRKTEKYMQDILGDAGKCSKENGIDIDLSIDIDNGIDTWGAVVSIIGGVTLLLSATNPWGLILGGIAVVVGFIKSLRGLFQHSYRREQQRKTADNNIRKISCSIEENIEKNLHRLYPDLKRKMELVKAEISKPVEVIKYIEDKLEKTGKELIQITWSIKGGE